MTEANLTSPSVRVIDSRNAPIIYCDGAAGLGFTNSIVTLTLAASIQTEITDGRVEMEHVAVAHLRMNTQAAISIRDAINRALLVAAPAEGKSN